MSENDIHQSVTVAASSDTVFKALTEADELTRWFLSKAESDPRTGGSFRYMWEFNDATKNGAQTGNYIEVAPNQKVSYPWAAGPEPSISTTVEVSLSAEGDGTKVDLMHTGWGPGEQMAEMSQMHADIWGAYLANLKSVLEQGVDGRAAMDQVVA